MQKLSLSSIPVFRDSATSQPLSKTGRMSGVTERFDLVPTSLAVTAMRDNGYRNTSYAIAELIDNAVQARATSVELLCCERQSFVYQRTRRNIHQIAVLDNGTGMDRAVLQSALQFGNGQYLNDRTGIGRFGMGLPSSSISQCRRVEVWTWQDGPTTAIYSYIDLNRVESDDQTTVPYPNNDASHQSGVTLDNPSVNQGPLLCGQNWTVVCGKPHRLSLRTPRISLDGCIGGLYTMTV